MVGLRCQTDFDDLVQLVPAKYYAAEKVQEDNSKFFKGEGKRAFARSSKKTKSAKRNDSPSRVLEVKEAKKRRLDPGEANTTLQIQEKEVRV